MPLSVGTRLGPYEILAPIGAGGMGEVFKARDTRLGRLVAIKVLPADKIADPERKRRFVQEAKAASALNHPNIVTIYDIGSEAGADFIVMEYIAGRSLDAVISRQGMRVREALVVAIPVADALARAHAAGIVHRDLKPANILVADDGTVKLLDFGLAKLIENVPMGELAETVAEGETPLTGDGAILGTVSYMSPEQAEGKAIDARSDIFAFGAVFYEMLTGRKAFHGESRVSTLAAILREEPKPLSEVAPAVPRELERMIARCLRKDPAKRWQSIADLRTSLQEFKEDSDSGLTAMKAAGIPEKMAGGRKPLWGLISIVVIAVAGAGLWSLRGKDAAQTERLHAVPLTSYPGTEQDPSFSPDGTQVAFSWDGEKQDNFDIYVKRIGPGPPLRLTSNPAADTNPAWSPDGSAIAFLRDSQPGKASVVLIPPLGGPERTVTQVALVQGTVEQTLAWSPDGKELIIFDRPLSEPGGLWLLSVETGDRRRLTTVAEAGSTRGDTGAAMAPDGSVLAYVRYVGNNSSDLYLLPLGQGLAPRGEPRRLTHENVVTMRPEWTADGRELVFAQGPPGDEPLWRIAIAGSTARKQLTEQSEVVGPTISRRLNRLVFQQATREMDIYRVELAGSGTEARGAIPVIASTRFDRQPSYSADGKRTAFASLRSGTWQIWASDGDGANAEQLTSFTRGETGYPSWSPDGAQIVFVSNAEGANQAYIVSAAGGKPRKLEALETGVNNTTWSTDGRWIFVSSDSGGSQKLWKIPIGGGTPVSLTHQGIVTRPAQSADGKLLYYARPGGMWSVPVDGGEEREVFKFDMDGNAAPAVSRLGIYFLPRTTASTPGELMFYRFPKGPIAKVSGVESPARWGQSVSPDGRYLLYTKMTSTGADLMLVENFK